MGGEIGRARERRAKHLGIPALLVLLSFGASACVVNVKRVEVQPIEQKRQDNYIATPIKVHLSNGETAMYTEGGRIVEGELRGKGYFYDIRLGYMRDNPRLTPVPMDSIAAMETYRERTDAGKTAALIPVSILFSAVAIGSQAGGDGMVISTGESLEKFPVAREPAGARCGIQMPHRVLAGELIAAGGDGIVLLRDKLRMIRYGDIEFVDFGKGMPRYKIKGQRSLKGGMLEGLSRLSRYPQGLSPGLLQKLLHAYGQAELGH